jgi:hypothetical protein
MANLNVRLKVDLLAFIGIDSVLNQISRNFNAEKIQADIAWHP